ncbi:MAG: glucose-1-phosphate adenylyltransferase [Negativicutes bacterium]|nr:glucose-1-phosphate adenylyltransferase [Negativicutes bacterium]
MRSKECVAMILAGGQGSRLGVLTNTLAKPAVPFGGKYRLIDFTLSNCHNSGFDTVGVLTQYQPLELHTYIGIGSPWDLDRNNGGVYILPPFVQARGGEWYKGTANSIYQNAAFIDQYSPEYVLVLSGDHIYKMDYSLMLKQHKESGADATIAVIEVPWKEASRFGIMHTGPGGRIVDFEEKPKEPKNNLASMGVYIFTWETLKSYLESDDKDESSAHDFGKNVIPAMLKAGRKMMAYSFQGYWKDVGTVESLWEANMDLLSDTPKFDLYDPDWRIFSVNPTSPPHLVAASGKVRRSLVSVGCLIFGEVENSVLFAGVETGPGSVVKDSVIMPGARIGAGVYIEKAIVGPQAVIEDGCQIGVDSTQTDGATKIVVVGEQVTIPADTLVSGGERVDRSNVHLKSVKGGRAG